MQVFTNLRPVLFGCAAVLGLLTQAPAARAQAPATTEVSQPDASSLSVRLNNPGQKRARLSVVSLSSDNWLLNEMHREPAYGTLLKFDTLPTGRYDVILKVGHKRRCYVVHVQAHPQLPSTITVKGLTPASVAGYPVSASL